MLVFYVEDDVDIRNLTLYALNQTNIETQGFTTGTELFIALQKTTPDLILLDVMLPHMDGISILQQLKSNPTTTDIPVIMLTAKGSESDIVHALNTGADDYLIKPFGMMELISRIKALMRRVNKNELGINPPPLAYDGIVINSDAHVITVDGQEVAFTLKEFNLLKLLLFNRGKVLSRQQILENVWGTTFVGESRTVDMHVLTIRHKLDAARPGASSLIETIRGVGYRFKVNNDQPE